MKNKKVFGRKTVAFIFIFIIITFSIYITNSYLNWEEGFSFLSFITAVLICSAIIQLKKITITQDELIIERFFIPKKVLLKTPINKISKVEVKALSSKTRPIVKVFLNNYSEKKFYLGFVFFETRHFVKYLKEDNRFEVVDRVFV